MTAPKRLRTKESGEIDGVHFEVSSGNVFTDLRLPNARLRLAKAKLAGQINGIIDDFGWTQAEAARKLGTHQPTISLLRKGRLSDISSERLLAWLGALHQDVFIKVSPSRTKQPRLEVVAAR